MLAVDHYPDFHPKLSMPTHELFEIHRSKISLHLAKADYSYPMIRLPHTFSELAGLSTRIYQTVHDGALAFLVVIASATTDKRANRSENVVLSAKTSVFTRQHC
jgi:hypothetical protein